MSTFNKLSVSLAAAALALPVTLPADTVIELNSHHEAATFMSNGKKARINTRGKSEYMIVDFASRTIYAVRPDEHQVINLNKSVPALSDNEPPEMKLAFVPSGNGPVVAGYATKSYRYSADGQDCGTIHASKEALNGTSIGSMLDAMNDMAENTRKSLGGFAAVIPPCQLASMSLGTQVSRIGAPLQTLNTHGEIQSAVDSIRKNVDVDAHNYELPADYQPADNGDRVADARKMNPEPDQPQHQEMIRQLQRSGRLPPDAVEQMQRYREMMRQRQW